MRVSIDSLLKRTLSGSIILTCDRGEGDVNERKSDRRKRREPTMRPRTP